ncbi:hypothetical protein JHK84_031760 [Glycine max]|nr:hypothetical protein JHK84_031760 [Glycine max]
MASTCLKLRNSSRGGAFRCGHYSKLMHAEADAKRERKGEEEAAPSSRICRSPSKILKELNKKVPNSLSMSILPNLEAKP